ncbi:MAG: VapC toxin family PIN domain ribonuclease [Desulfurococcales archaeon ex4484_217_2]|nr:MAG: VapC toxin family PIN domain ribonuclease [Desulfurococcales archaeon ex4484_217_2]
MVRSEEVYYLDTSALVKRYVSEPGSDVVDSLFSSAYRGVAVLSLSYWNIVEAAVVFDRYGRELGLNAKNLTRNLLRELKTLSKLQRLIVVGVSPSIFRETIRLILKHHIYVADALQIVSATKSRSNRFATGDKKLVHIAEAEGLKTLLLKAK